MAGAKPTRKLIAECSENGPRGASVLRVIQNASVARYPARIVVPDVARRAGTVRQHGPDPAGGVRGGEAPRRQHDGQPSVEPQRWQRPPTGRAPDP